MKLGHVTYLCYGDIAVFLQPKQHIHSIAFENILLMTACNLSYRKSAFHINMLLGREGDHRVKSSTLEEHVESTGRAIKRSIEQQADKILQETSGFSEQGLPVDLSAVSSEIKTPCCSDAEKGEAREIVFADVIQAYNSDKQPADQIKDSKLINDTELSPDNCVYVSIDDVGVDQQKNTRKGGGSKDGKVVENTVIHVQSKEGTHTITAIGMKKAFKLLMAFLLVNHLLENRHLYFFSDGARNIRSNIEIFFKPLCPYVHMLDWYHLEKRMTELLSMALKGPKAERHMLRYELDQKLWVGNIDDAKAYLNGLDPKYIKNRQKLDEALEYLEGKRAYIACYALRKELQYRNSSNPAEKENDLVVAGRQKHNGMSWSRDGSGSLAVITAEYRNGGMHSWICDKVIPFTMTCAKKKAS